MSKKRIGLILVLLLCSYIAYGIHLIFFQFNLFDTTIISEHPTKFYDYSGITHIHTNKSSGSGSVQHIIEQAQQSQLKFIYLTDLNDFNPDKKIEGYYDDLMLFVGAEYNYLDSKILNYHRSDFNRLNNIGQVQVRLTDTLEKKNAAPGNGRLVLSHPSKEGYKWSGQYPDGLSGIEVVNLKSVWQKSWLQSKVNFLWALLIYPFNPKLALTRIYKIPNSNIQLWNKLNEHSKTIGFLGSDAEAKMFVGQYRAIKFPSYKTIFSFAKTHVLLASELTGQFQQDQIKIQNAIENGQFYFSLDLIQDPKGFEAYIQDTKENIFPLGSELTWKNSLDFKVTLPNVPKKNIKVIFYKNGQPLMTSNSKINSMTIHTPGVYRVVVQVKYEFPFPEKSRWLDWIYTNPIYVRPQAQPSQ